MFYGCLEVLKISQDDMWASRMPALQALAQVSPGAEVPHVWAVGGCSASVERASSISDCLEGSIRAMMCSSVRDLFARTETSYARNSLGLAMYREVPERAAIKSAACDHLPLPG